MRKLVLVLAAVAALFPAAAAGGGWATVGLSSLPPQDLRAGAEWAVDLTILQHGRTPLEHVQPVVRLHGPDGARHEYAATPSGKPGVYTAVVRFPAGGTWRYEVDDGFTRTHTFAPVVVGPASSPAPFPALPVVGIALALVLGTGLLVALRRRRLAPEPASLVH